MGGVFASPLYFTGGKSLDREILGAGIVGFSLETRLAVITVAGRSPSFGTVSFNSSPETTAVQSTRLSTPEDSRIIENDTLSPFTRPSTINMMALPTFTNPLSDPPSAISATVHSRFRSPDKFSVAVQRPVTSAAAAEQTSMKRATKIFIAAIIAPK
jgi:hypothetical protein